MYRIENYLKNQIELTLKKLGISEFPPVIIENPKQAEHGDKSSTIALNLARPLKKNPRQIAEEIINNLSLDKSVVEGISIAGPGFINFTLSPQILRKHTSEILEAESTWGKSNQGEGKRALVEFVSANPTGPLTIGHGRQAVLGDTIARILEWNGYKVEREYYFNNAGRQMRILGESLRLRYLELLGESIEFPEEFYQGEYLIDIARTLLDKHGDSLKDTPSEPFFKEYAEQEIFKDIKATLGRMRIHFDSFFNEKSLYDKGKIDELLHVFKEKNLSYEKDGAVWLKTSELGMEQDRVIVKSTGEPTYRLPDIAYHIDKFERDYDYIIDIFGADHIATYPDVVAALKALGYNTDKMKVLIHQFVTLMEGENKVKMSTRKANFVTLDELMDEVGEDVTRYFFIMRSMDSHLNFDLSLAKKASDENPVFYNQYAHARICSILRNAGYEKMDTRLKEADWSILSHPAEINLMKQILEFTKAVVSSANHFEPHRIPNYLVTLSETFHKFYHECQVIVEDENLKKARLALCEATRVTLENGLFIIGVSAPDKM
ncbi:MAG: arginine--tRNA ligase [Calditrichia bacterium]